MEIFYDLVIIGIIFFLLLRLRIKILSYKKLKRENKELMKLNYHLNKSLQNTRVISEESSPSRVYY